jgi:hypothetical protein
MTHTKDEALLKALEEIKNNAGNPEKVYQISSAAIKKSLAAPVQEPCGWQFYQDGKWHNGMETNNHRSNTEAAGVPTRNIYPFPPAAPVAITTGMALAFHRATSDGSISDAEAKEIKLGLEAAFANITTQPAAQPAPVRDKSGTDYADLQAKWRKQRQENANLQRAHLEALAELASLKAAQPAPPAECKHERVDEDYQIASFSFCKHCGKEWTTKMEKNT